MSNKYVGSLCSKKHRYKKLNSSLRYFKEKRCVECCKLKSSRTKVDKTKRKIYQKAYQKLYYISNKEILDENRILYRKKWVDELKTSYIETLLSSTLGLAVKDITKEMIEIKRNQMIIHRRRIQIIVRRRKHA